jgi:hypothetical protein
VRSHTVVRPAAFFQGFPLGVLLEIARVEETIYFCGPKHLEVFFAGFHCIISIKVGLAVKWFAGMIDMLGMDIVLYATSRALYVVPSLASNRVELCQNFCTLF